MSAVTLNVLFYGVENKGDLADTLIDFADGARFALGCAGDGGIYVVRPRGDQGDPPGFITHRRTLEKLSGELHSVSVLPQALQLQIGGWELLFVNEDDELSLTVDGKALSQEILRR